MRGAMSSEIRFEVAALNQNNQTRRTSGSANTLRRNRPSADRRIEMLESRCLLSAAVSSAMPDVIYGPVLRGKGGMLPKVDATLNSLSKEYASAAAAGSVASFGFHTRDRGMNVVGDRIAIEAFAEP